jgi:hypothetical protein
MAIDPEVQHGTDEELEAEARAVASMIYNPELIMPGLDPKNFCCPFYGALYAHICAASLCGQIPDPVLLWERVQTHPDAEMWGLGGIVHLVDEAARPSTFAKDMHLTSAHAMRVLMARLDAGEHFGPELPDGTVH